MTKRVFALLAVITVLGLLAACAQPTPEVIKEVVKETVVVEKEVPKEVEKVVKETVVVEKEVAVEAPAEEWDGTLVIAVSGPVEHWDPAWDSFSRAYENTFHLYDRILMLLKTEEIGGVQVVPGDSLHMQPRFAERIEVSPDAAALLPVGDLDWVEVMDEDPGQTTYILHLREGIKFPSGNELTAHDIKWTSDHKMWDIGRTFNPVTYASVTSADAITVLDDYTVQFVAEGPNSLALHYWEQWEVFDSELVMEHATEDDPYGAEWLKTNPAGVGPYVVEKVEGDDVFLVKNPDYYAEELGLETVYPERLIFKVIPDATQRALLLASGEVDIAENIPPSEIEFLKATPGVKVFTAPTKEQFFLAMGNQTPPFDNEAVREAVCYAVPYADILEGVFLGEARRSNSPIPKSVPYHDGSLSPYEQDLDKARELLSDAGYADGFEVDLTINLSNPFMEPAAILVQDALAKIGVEVNIKKLDPAAYSQRIRDLENQEPFWLASRHAWVGEPEYQLNLFFHSAKERNANWYGYNNPRVDEIIKAAPAADPVEREALWREAQQLILDEAPVCFIAHPAQALAAREGIEGFVLTNTGAMRYTTFRYE